MELLNLLSDRKEGDRDGSCPEKAIIVFSVVEEYQWIKQNCRGFTVCMQELHDIDTKPYDVLILRSPAGEERKIYFDISQFFQFFGKRSERAPGPPCPYCGTALRTDKAKQCPECGMDWHDPANVVCRKHV